MPRRPDAHVQGAAPFLLFRRGFRGLAGAFHGQGGHAAAGEAVEVDQGLVDGDVRRHLGRHERALDRGRARQGRLDVRAPQGAQALHGGIQGQPAAFGMQAARGRHQTAASVAHGGLQVHGLQLQALAAARRHRGLDVRQQDAQGQVLIAPARDLQPSPGRGHGKAAGQGQMHVQPPGHAAVGHGHQTPERGQLALPVQAPGKRGRHVRQGQAVGGKMQGQADFQTGLLRPQGLPCGRRQFQARVQASFAVAAAQCARQGQIQGRQGTLRDLETPHVQPEGPGRGRRTAVQAALEGQGGGRQARHDRPPRGQIHAVQRQAHVHARGLQGR